MGELTVVCEQIERAQYPEDIFGIEANVTFIKSTFRQLSKVVHPDRNNGDAQANDAFVKLTEYYAKATRKLTQGIYGDTLSEEQTDISDSESFTIQTRKNTYTVTKTLAEGDLGVVYGGQAIGDVFTGPVAVKVVDDSADNDLMQNEIKILRLFKDNPASQLKHLPVLLDRFKTSDGQLGTIMERIDGYDLYSIREGSRWKYGIDQKHVVWMMNRALSALGYVHNLGCIHGNIDPSHIMIRPKDHNAWLIDWCYSALNPARTNDGFKVFNEEFSAPEVVQKKSPLPASDLYSLGKTMIFALGGDVKTNAMPASVNVALQRFLKFFTLESPRQRAQDAWEVHAMLNELVIELWGPKKFLEFRI